MSSLKVIHSETLEKLVALDNVFSDKDKFKFRLIKATKLNPLFDKPIFPESIEGELYQHFKGNKYLVVGEAVSNEDYSEYVIYKPLKESKDFPDTLWARPKEMFYEKIIRDGKEISRFKKV